MAEAESIHVRINRDRIAIDRAVFETLFLDSVVAHYVGVQEALRDGVMTFSVLVELARKASIPYALFFAPRDVVEAQADRNLAELLKGVSKDTFSLNSRSRVSLADVQNIIKDLLRKQEELKARDSTLVKNTVVGVLGGRRAGVDAQADRLRDAIGFSLATFRAYRTKEASLDYLIGCLESRQVLVSQANATALPQHIPPGVSFSGICVKDQKVPYVVIGAGGGEDPAEPAGRRILTLSLLAALVARGKFAVVSYGFHGGTPLDAPEWELAEELLVPSAELRGDLPTTFEEVLLVADLYRVTPSAMCMRLQRLGHFDRVTTVSYLGRLRAEFEARPSHPFNQPLIHNAVRNYAGREYVRRMFDALDTGRVSQGDFRRIVTLNKLQVGQFPDLRRAL